MDEKGLGKHLQKVRRDGGLTQQELCQKAGLSYSTLTKIERGAIKAPSIFTIQSIAAALGVSLDQLMGNPPGGPTAQKHVSKSGIRFVYFDLNDCLVRFHASGLTRLAHDSNQPLDVIESIFLQYNTQLCRGEVAIDSLNTALSERLGIAVDWKQSYLKAVDAMPGITELVEWTAQNYRMGILSNTMPGFISSLRERQLIPDVSYDAIVDSSVVGAVKPEVKIFEIAADEAHCSPDEILLIDDDRPNLAAARQLGWHTIWFDGYQPEACIESIRSALAPAD